MTPEQRAEKLTGWLWDEAGIATNGLTQKVAEAIRAACNEALEEAAKVAEAYEPSISAMPPGMKIAAAIREKIKP